MFSHVFFAIHVTDITVSRLELDCPLLQQQTRSGWNWRLQVTQAVWGFLVCRGCADSLKVVPALSWAVGQSKEINWTASAMKKEDAGFPQNFERHSSNSTASHADRPNSANNNSIKGTSVYWNWVFFASGKEYRQFYRSVNFQIR
jgi:hypothetical protein